MAQFTLSHLILIIVPCRDNGDVYKRQLLGSLQGFGQGKDGAARRARNAAAFQQLIKAFAVLGFIDGIGRGAVNGQADLIHMLCQLDGRLAAELHQAAVRLVGSDNMVNAFGVQRDVYKRQVP